MKGLVRVDGAELATTVDRAPSARAPSRGSMCLALTGGTTKSPRPRATPRSDREHLFVNDHAAEGSKNSCVVECCGKVVQPVLLVTMSSAARNVLAQWWTSNSMTRRRRLRMRRAASPGDTRAA